MTKTSKINIKFLDSYVIIKFVNMYFFVYNKHYDINYDKDGDLNGKINNKWR